VSVKERNTFPFSWRNDRNTFIIYLGWFSGLPIYSHLYRLLPEIKYISGDTKQTNKKGIEVGFLQ